MQHRMREHGFGTNINDYHLAVLKVLSKDTIGEARKQLAKFQETRTAVSILIAEDNLNGSDPLLCLV